MNSVKTYQKVNAENHAVNFTISKMEDIYLKRNGKADDPHRHNYFTVIVINKAKGLHKVDFKSYDLDKRQIYFVTPGQVHQIIEKEKPEGVVVTFSNQFLLESSIPLSFISSLNLFQNYGLSPPLLPSKEQFKTVVDITNHMFSLFHSELKMKNLSIGAYLKIFLIECNNICEVNPIESGFSNSGNNLIRAFKEKVDQFYKQEHSIKYYASELYISPDHLSRTIKSKMGKTAKEYIQSRIVAEAKRLLYFTALSNKEIGYELGFNDPANFSAFFKKHTQLSPSKLIQFFHIP